MGIPDTVAVNGTGRRAKLGQVPIRTILLDRLRPSPLNDQLYRPVSPDDPDILALARSIKNIGLREPIVVTKDHVILSGHRRYAACKLAGLTVIPVRVENIHSTDPKFLALLREFNRQRVKALDELLREEVVSADPEESHRRLRLYREQKADLGADDGFTIRGMKTRAVISAAKQPFIDAIQRVLKERRKFWPLTDRQIHYVLLNNPPLIHAGKPGSKYKNNGPSYKALCELLTRARLAELIPWNAIADPTRPVTIWHVFREPSGFIQEELDGFLKGYYRDLQQSQPNHIEIIGEKNTIAGIVRPVAMDYCIPLTIGRGFCSLPPRRDLAERYWRSGKEKLVLLFLTDFDPDGEEIAHSFARSLRDDFDVGEVGPIKVALSNEQVLSLDLPPAMQTKEKKSTNRKKFVEKYGTDTYELEAVPPAQLQQILRDAIDAVLDVDAFNAEVEAEKADAVGLDVARRRLADNIARALRPEGGDA